MARSFSTNRIQRSIRSRGAAVLLALGVLALVAALATSACGGEASDAPTIDGTSQSNGGGLGLAFPGGGSRESAGADGDAGAPAPGMAPDESRAESSPPGEQALPSFQVTGREIIRSGAMSIEVESVAEAFEQVSQVATTAGGYVSDSSFTGSGERQAARLTVRVPSDRFSDVMRQLRDLAVDVREVTTGAQDVTEEVADIEATLRNLRAVEAQYVELLSRANSIGDVLQVQDRLNQTRQQIERVEGRRATLANLTQLSTINVALYPQREVAEKVEPRTGPLAAAGGAWQASLEVLEAIATGVVVAVVFSWWMLPLLLIAAVVWRATRRRTVEIDTPQGSA